jgi:hypothetical protein
MNRNRGWDWKDSASGIKSLMPEGSEVHKEPGAVDAVVNSLTDLKPQGPRGKCQRQQKQNGKKNRLPL